MYDSSTYKSEVENQLSYTECIKVLDDFVKTSDYLGATPHISFSGGDPLLRKDFFDLLEECKKRKVTVSILGNPYLVTNELAKKMKELGVKSYQISLDGLEETHDFFRKKGSFKDSLRAFGILKKNRIKTVCMFTLSKTNSKDLIPLIHFIKDKVDVFDFARLVPTGKGKQLKSQLFKPQEYKEFLLEVLEEYRKLNGKTKTKFGRKDHLWTLLYHDLGLFYPKKKVKTISGGCSIGIRHLSILSDGQVMACRRMPLVIGKVPNQSLKDIFLKSKELNKMREIEKMEKCNKCELLNYCRGCPAVAYAVSGSYYSPDPQCWR
jgi:radical SAM/SPASM domain protein of ACGX system